MIKFQSGSSTAVNSANAVRESLELAHDGDPSEARLVVVHSTMGHNFQQLLAAVREQCPEARIVGCTGSGVIGKEGVSESMRALALLTVTGSEFGVAHVKGVTGTNSKERALECAKQLADTTPGVNMVYVLGQGLDVCGDHVIDGIEAVFGPQVKLLGALAGDNAKLRRTIQFHDEEVLDDALLLIGFADQTLELVQGVHHGSLALEGMVFEVTASESNRIDELDGKPAWPTLTERLGIPIEKNPGEVIAITGLGIDLDEGESKAYDNDQILRAPFQVSEDRQSFFLMASCPVGTKLHMMQRDEDHIFSGVDRMMQGMVERLDGRRPLAVFQADCMARGRMAFNRILKDEIIAKMQVPLCGDEVVPWLGVYGFAEFCQLGQRNAFHHFTTSLSAIVRKPTDESEGA